MADDFAQSVKSLLKNADTISVDDYQMPILVKKGTAYALPEIDATSGGLMVDIVSANGVTFDANLDYTDDEVTVWGSSDGGTTRYAIRTDTSGQIETAHDVNTNPIFSKVTDGTNQVVIAVDGAAVGANGFHALGTDGTNAQILSTDTAGQIQTAHDANTNPIFAKVTDGTNQVDVAVAGSAHKTYGIQVMGTDGTNATRLRTNAAGELIVDIGAEDSAHTRSSVNLVKDTETTVVTRSPASAEEFVGVTVSGFGLCHWQIQFGTTLTEATIIDVQTTPSKPNEHIMFPAPLKVSAAQTIRVRGTNRENAASPSSDFTGYATLIRRN